MSPTDTSEKGLETLIVVYLVNEAGYVQGTNDDYSREHVIDPARLRMFLEATQPETAEALCLDRDCPKRTQFLHRLDAESAKRGVIDVLRKGVKHGPVSLELFYGTPTPGNTRAAELHKANIFSVTRQLRYSRDERQLALDLGLFINGLPVATFELKNSLTKQTVDDAVRQYKRDRSPKEPLFKFGRCMVHFAVDDHEVRMCTHLKGKDSWFLSFNRGWDNGAGNPPNPAGLKTDYLLHDLKASLDGYQVYSSEQVDELVRLFLGGENRDKLDPTLDGCVGVYNEELVEDEQADFKGNQ